MDKFTFDFMFFTSGFLLAISIMLIAYGIYRLINRRK